MKVAVIGCGAIAMERNLPALRSIAGVTVTAVADSDAKRAEAAARQFGVERYFTDYRELLREAEAEVVAVTAPAALHGEMGSAVLEAGKHLMLEKPVAVTREEAAALVRCAAGKKVRAMVGLNLRAHRLVRRAREVVASGALGRIEAIRSTLANGVRNEATAAGWRRERSLGGGVFLDLSVHHFDVWRYLVGAEIEQVRAVARSGEWMDEAGAVAARLSNGAVATMVMTQGARAVNQIEILGSKAQLRLDCYRFDGLTVSGNEEPAGSIGARIKGGLGMVGEAVGAWQVLRRGGDWVDSYRAQWQHFLETLAGAEPWYASLEDGARALDAALRAAESASQ
jgi:predicted dehydrogenase